MIIQDLFTGKKDEISIRIKPSISGETFPKVYNVEVRVTYKQDAYWLVYENNQRVEAIGITPEDRSNLDRITTDICITLLVKSENTKAEIKARLFTNRIPITDGIEIGFGDIIVDDIDKRFSRQKGARKPEDWLKEELLIETTKNNKYKILIRITPDEKGIRIIGNSIAVDIKRNEDDKFELIRILRGSNRFQPNAFIEAEISINDISQTGKMRADISNALSSESSTEKYIKTWEKYKEKEKEYAELEVKKIGFLIIKAIKKVDKSKYQLFYKKDKNTDNWLQIITGSYIDLQSTPKVPTFDSYDKESTDIIICKLLMKENGFVLVESDTNLSISKDEVLNLNVSLLGNVIMHSRQQKALELIRENATPMPQLSGVLENIDIPTIERRKIKPITLTVKKEFGEYGPNAMQELAIDIALNTPDIAIIQGPPGTGKTKVISALAKRVTELYKEEGKAPRMNLLLTAFQHDAVENMVSRTEVLGLPALKISNTVHQTIDIIDKWISKQAVKIESIQNSIDPNEDEFIYKDIVSSYLNYISTLNKEEAIKNLFQIRKKNITVLSDKIINDISNLTIKEKKADDELLNKLLELTRNIRTDEISYADDGYLNLKRFIKNYEIYAEELPNINVSSYTLIKELVDKEYLRPDDFDKLDKIKIELLELFTAKEVVEQLQMPDAKIELLFKSLIDFFTQRIKLSGSIYTVLSDYQNDLTSNKERVKKTIQKYVAILASTVQGSKSANMFAMKEDPFDSVIVDEAARANPLDLIIPLTSAKRRIVLVGDHRQLPHLIDNAIQKELIVDENAAANVSKFLEDSLFERFYTILKNLKEKDNVERVVTLDTQYRMHPVIGNFISKTFYERYGDPKINSGTSKEKLIHGINEFDGKVAISINIPNIKQNEIKQSGSTYRPYEAIEIVRQAKKILDSDPSISVGIITFYGRQVTEIFSYTMKQGLTEKDEDGEFKIKKKYIKTIEGEERFRIGSVDAFQGLEFDVVLLSLVRSNTISIKNKLDIRRKFGFLTSYNRLNVAMSRAKKLLVIVGDEKMFTSVEAKENVYGLFAFYNELINSEYGLSI